MLLVVLPIAKESVPIFFTENEQQCTNFVCDVCYIYCCNKYLFCRLIEDERGCFEPAEYYNLLCSSTQHFSFCLLIILVLDIHCLVQYQPSSQLNFLAAVYCQKKKAWLCYTHCIFPPQHQRADQSEKVHSEECSVKDPDTILF